MPLLDLAISRPKKYFKEPKTFSLNMDCNLVWTLTTHEELGPASIMSSTYTRTASNEDPTPK